MIYGEDETMNHLYAISVMLYVIMDWYATTPVIERRAIISSVAQS